MANPSQHPTAEQIRVLPKLHSEHIPSQWEDDNNHINVTYYMDLYNRSGWPMFAKLGIDETYFSEQQKGIVDLENHIRYFRELHVDNRVSVYCRYLAYDMKRFHGMMIIVNDNTEEVACAFEFLTLSVDLAKRKSTPWPESVINYLKKQVGISDQLPWHYPTTMSLDR